jgi:hypothetical protein
MTHSTEFTLVQGCLTFELLASRIANKVRHRLIFSNTEHSVAPVNTWYLKTQYNGIRTFRKYLFKFNVTYCITTDLNFSQQWLWGFQSFEIWRCVDCVQLLTLQEACCLNLQGRPRKYFEAATSFKRSIPPYKASYPRRIDNLLRYTEIRKTMYLLIKKQTVTIFVFNVRAGMNILVTNVEIGLSVFGLVLHSSVNEEQ